MISCLKDIHLLYQKELGKRMCRLVSTHIHFVRQLNLTSYICRVIFGYKGKGLKSSLKVLTKYKEFEASFYHL